MKKIWKTVKQKTTSAFTLVEMLVVLLIISVLMLLFVPNLTKQKDAVQEKGNAAVVKVVDSQMQLYELKEGKTGTPADLLAKGYITRDQLDTYNAQAKN